jgi:hypothetical protein
LLAVLAHDRGGGFEANADPTPVIDIGALGGNPFDDIFGRQHATVDCRNRERRQAQLNQCESEPSLIN